MPVLQIEHPVRDFETWKAAFDGGQERREAGRVRRYQVYRPIDDPKLHRGGPGVRQSG